MARTVDYDKLNSVVIDLFGQGIDNVKSIVMAEGEAVITYWPTPSDRSRIVTDTYQIQKELSNG